MAVASRVLTAFREFGIFCGEVMNVNCPAFDYGTPGDPTSIDRKSLGGVASCRNPPIRGYLTQDVAIEAEDYRIVGIAEAGGTFPDLVQYRLRLSGRV